EPVRLAEDLITFFRDLLLLQTSRELDELLELVTPEEKFMQLAHEYSADNLYGFIDILAKTQQEMRYSHHTKIYLETALLKMAQYSNVGGVTQSTASAGNVVDPQLMDKVATLEKMVQSLTQQLQSGVQPAATPQAKESPRPRAKSQNYNAPVGKIK